MAALVDEDVQVERCWVALVVEYVRVELYTVALVVGTVKVEGLQKAALEVSIGKTNSSGPPGSFVLILPTEPVESDKLRWVRLADLVEPGKLR